MAFSVGYLGNIQCDLVLNKNKKTQKRIEKEMKPILYLGIEKEGFLLMGGVVPII